MSLSSNCTAQDDLHRLTLLAERCTSDHPQVRSPMSDHLWLDRTIGVFTAMAHATRTEYLQAGLPSKPIAGTSFRTVPINPNFALAEGREGIVGLVGNGELFVFTTLTTSFRTFVTEDCAENSALSRTLLLAQELTDLRGRARRQRILLNKQVS